MEIAKLKTVTLILALVGAILFGAGWATNHKSDEDIKTEFADQLKKYGKIVPVNSVDVHSNDHEAEAHLEQGQHQVHNKPWAALLAISMLFFGLSAAALFFFSIQHAAQAGWSIVVTRIMEAIASFLPYGAIFLGIVVLASGLHMNHLYHWMDPDLIDPKSPHYDFLTDSKHSFLNVPFWWIRILIYFGGCIFFLFKLKGLSKRLDETGEVADHKKLYKWSVLFICFFALASAAWAWDFLMSLDHHWYSTLYIWYTMVSCLVSAVAFMLIFSIYMSKQGRMPKFNKDHQHDLTKYLFGFSMLWSYLWFDQFMLIWYANIPEEVGYFLGRFVLYPNSYFWMLIPNLLMPLLILISSNIKRNSKVVLFMCFVIILGHVWDFFNIVFPGTVGGFWNDFTTVLLLLGALLGVGGVFGFVVLKTLDKMNLEPTGNPYFHESETYEYPY